MAWEDGAGVDGGPPRRTALLSFTDAALEAKYQVAAAKAALPSLRFGMILGAGLWVVGAVIVDVATPVKRLPLLLICGGMALANLVAFFLVSRASTLGRQQWVAGVLNGLSGIALLVLAEEALVFGRLAVPAVMLTAIFAFVALRLRFVAAVAAVMTYVIFYLVRSVEYFPDFRPLDYFLVATAVVASAAGAYLLERSERDVFAQRQLIEAQKEEIEHERARSDRLLLEMLPAPIAERLRIDPGVIADRVEDVTILFADLVGFTPLAEHMRPEDVVELLNMLFSHFDDLTYGFGLEKIKTSGDGYMAAGGLDLRRSSHARDVVRLGLAMIGEVEATAAARALDIALRVGIHTGPVVAGVIGKHRYSYDIWGDTVNVASRMESHGIPGAVQLSEATKILVEAEYPCIPGKDIEVKGHGRMRVYLVEREGAAVR